MKELNTQKWKANPKLVIALNIKKNISINSEYAKSGSQAPETLTKSIHVNNLEDLFVVVV